MSKSADERVDIHVTARPPHSHRPNAIGIRQWRSRSATFLG